ncbi:MAG: Druantia anti-phage system protein DruA [Nitrospirota bacterium]
MEIDIKYQGKVATKKDIEFIKKLINGNPNDSRRTLSKKLCKAWDWVQPNGDLRDMVCRGFLLRLESAGHIKLPPRRFIPNNPLVNRKNPPKVEIDRSPIKATLSEIQPLEIQQVRNTPCEKLFNSLIAQYHYLGYCHPVGEHLKYIVFAKERPIACMAWSSAPRHIGCRDKFIGWSADIRKKNLHLIAYNSRYLILPWIKVLHFLG